MANLNDFTVQPQRDGNKYTSYIDSSTLVGLAGSDPYFDSTSKFSRIDILYLHSGLREEKEVAHYWDGTRFMGQTSWSTFAQSGTWMKMRARLRDTDGALGEITRAQIGTSQDLTLS